MVVVVDTTENYYSERDHGERERESLFCAVLFFFFVSLADKKPSFINTMVLEV